AEMIARGLEIGGLARDAVPLEQRARHDQRHAGRLSRPDERRFEQGNRLGSPAVVVLLTRLGGQRRRIGQLTRPLHERHGQKSGRDRRHGPAPMLALAIILLRLWWSRPYCRAPSTISPDATSIPTRSKSSTGCASTDTRPIS